MQRRVAQGGLLLRALGCRLGSSGTSSSCEQLGPSFARWSGQGQEAIHSLTSPPMGSSNVASLSQSRLLSQWHQVFPVKHGVQPGSADDGNNRIDERPTWHSAPAHAAVRSVLHSRVGCAQVADFSHGSSVCNHFPMQKSSSKDDRDALASCEVGVAVPLNSGTRILPPTASCAKGLAVIVQPREMAQGFKRGRLSSPVFNHLGARRGYAKMMLASPRQVKVRVYLQSPGVIGEPYRRLEPPLPFPGRWLTREGWRRRRKEWMDTLKTAFTVAKLRRESGGYRKVEFYRDAAALYSEVNKAIAAGDRTMLRHMVTESTFSVLKREMKQREEAGWDRVVWSLAGIPEIRTAQARIVSIDEKNPDRGFAQITLLIRSKQIFAAYNTQGKLVAGDPDKEINVEDCWVFERTINRPENKWRLCGRLTL